MNRATRIISAVFGALIGFSGMNHGFFEALQGNKPTGGWLIMAVAPGSSWTIYSQGSEGAFTLVPNFLVTGLLAMLIGLVVIIWSLVFLPKKNGSLIFLLLCLTLLLAGGGIAQVVFFLMIWAFSTRIDAPLNWWCKALPQKARSNLARLWPWTLSLSVLLFLFALELAIFGYLPGVTDQNSVLYICWSAVGITLITFPFTYISVFAADIEKPAYSNHADNVNTKKGINHA